MDREKNHLEGYRRASRDAVAWMYARVAEMNDPHAKQILNSAADNMSSYLKRRVAGSARVTKGAGHGE